MHRDPADVSVEHLALAGVKAGANLDSQSPCLLADRQGAADRSSRPVEGRKDAVAQHLYLLSPKPLELRPDRRLMSRQELPPARVPKLGGTLGRPDDICEHHRGEHAV